MGENLQENVCQMQYLKFNKLYYKFSLTISSTLTAFSQCEVSGLSPLPFGFFTFDSFIFLQIDPSEKLDAEVEDILVDIAEDFVDSVSISIYLSWAT